MKPIEIVDKLNDLIWGEDAEYEENFNISFSYHYYSTFEMIKFEDIILWDSENDEREWLEEKNDYEDLFEFCKKEFCKMGNKMLVLNKLIKK